jgi:hypothetical protein
MLFIAVGLIVELEGICGNAALACFKICLLILYNDVLSAE